MELSLEDIDHMKRSIEKSIPGEMSVVKDCLEQLSGLKATEDLLRKTDLGNFISKLRKDSRMPEDLAATCKELVRKWKDDVGHNEKKEPKMEPKHPKEHHHVKEEKAKEKEERVKDEKKENGKLKIETEQPEPSSSASKATTKPETPLTERREGRSAKEDGITLSRTGHTSRDKCSEMIYAALSYVTWANPEMVAKAALAIEQETWEEYSKFGNNDGQNLKYKDRVRSLIFNLKAKDNPALRENVVTGQLPVAEFCRMTTAEMASDDLKKEWEAIQKQNIMDAQVHVDNSAETDMFKCGKCGQRRTKYYQMQTRSADEPMTTFVTCINCNNRWKFC